MDEGCKDTIVRCVIDGGAARVVAVTATDLAREAARRHRATGAAAAAMARTGIAGLLLATLTKDEERVTLQILGGGPLGALTADASASGTVRMLIKHPLPLAAPAGTRPSLGAAVGRSGIVSVIRDVGLGENFSGQTAIRDGEIDSDVEGYLTDSEQIDSALRCEVLLDDAGAVRAAAGVLVQALPGSGEGERIAAARARLQAGALLGLLAGAGAPPDATAVARAALGGDGAAADVALTVLDERPVRFFCPCSRERAAAALALIGDGELATLIREDGMADVVCDFCRARYDFTDAALEEIRRAARASPVDPS